MIYRQQNIGLKLIVLVFGFHAVNSKLAVLFGEEFEDCSEGGHAKHIDFSGLGYEYINESAYCLDGK